MAGERITIDISILQGIFGDLTKLQQQLAGVGGSAMALDSTASGAFSDIQESMQGVVGSLGGVEAGFDATMRGVVGDLMQPIARAQELEAKLARLGQEVRTSKSVGEITKLKKEIAATQQELDRVNTGTMENKVSAGTGRMRSMFRSLAAPIAGAFAVGGITNFIGGVAKAAGETQAFEGSLQALLQSKEKADALGAQVKEFAAQTPFSANEVRQSVTQFIGFGFEADKVIDTLGNLGDVAAGLNVPFGDLAQTYGRLKEGDVLDSLSLKSFQRQGIPIVRELANVLGVSKDEVTGLVSEGKVGFSALEQAFANMTAEGGIFYGQLAAKSNSITGQLSNLGDTWEGFKSHIGEAFAPLISNSLGAVSDGIEKLRAGFDWVVAHGQAIKEVFVGLGIATAAYGAMLLVNNRALIWNNALQAMAAVRSGAMALWTGLTTTAVGGATAAQWSWNAALLANPIGLVIAGIAALVGAVLYAWHHFEGFRAAVYGLWEAAKSTFSGLLGLAKTYLGPLGEMAGGLGQILKGVFTLSWDDVSAGWKQMAQGTANMLKSLAETPGKVRDIGLKAGMAYAQGDAEGRASFQADQAKKSEGTNAYNATPQAPGQNVGAAGLVGGQAPATKGEGSGVTVGGSTGSGRVITMNIEMKNSFALPKDGNMGAREVAERVIGQLVAKLNDAQFAMG